MIDTHCHLNDFEAFPDAERAVHEAKEAGVDRLIVVGIDEEWSQRAVDLAERFEGVFAVVGHHPNSAATFQDSSLELYRQLYSHPKVVAIGEIGLDYHWTYATKEQQFHALNAQLDLARELDAPVVFHCREAYPDLLDLLETRSPQPFLFHCFAGDTEDARRALEIGAMFGFDGPVTYKKADALRELIQSLPLERIVIETDAPWMAPEPYRGKPNHPKYLPLVLRRLSQVLDLSESRLEATLDQNSMRFFGIPAP